MNTIGLDLPHVLLGVEWLAKLHGLTYVAKKRFESSNPKEDWYAKNPWIKSELEDTSKNAPDETEQDQGDVAGGLSLKNRLIGMARKAILAEKKVENEQFEKLVQAQDWLEEMRKESGKSESTNGSFVSVCHGQPWIGNIYFKYESGTIQIIASVVIMLEVNYKVTFLDVNGQKIPTQALFTDFQSCAVGKTGQDLAHFLLTSTTREFRAHHLETILQAYLTELEDVLNHLGCFDEPMYNLTTLRGDYRRGIYMGISFCLFAMPMLNNTEVDGSVIENLEDTTDGLEMKSNVALERSIEALMEYLFTD